MTRREVEPKYFVWRFDEHEPYRVYGTKNHFEPAEDDQLCVWRGDSIEDARAACKKANAGRKQIILDL